MKLMKKLLCVALLAALMLAIAAPALADISVPEEETSYLLSTDGSMTWWSRSVYIGGTTASTKIKNMKSSKSSVVSVIGLSRSTEIEEYFGEEEGRDPDEWGSASLLVRPKKAGKANITMKIDGKIYKTVYTVKKYVNPIKSLVLTGVGTKNLKNKFAKRTDIDDSLKANAKKGAIKVKAASGWRISEIRWENETTGLEYSQWMRNDVTSASLDIPAMKKTEEYRIVVYFRNIADDGSLSMEYYLRPAEDD